MENTFLLAQPQNNRLRKILDLMTNVMPIGMIFNVSKKVDYFDLIDDGVFLFFVFDFFLQ